MRLAALLVLACGVLTATAAAAQTCKLHLVSAIDMAVSPEHLTVPVSINGTQKDFRFELGMNTSAVSQALVDELSLHTRQLIVGHYSDHSVITVGRVPITDMADVPKFRIGILAADPVPMMVLPDIVNPTKDAGRLGIGLFDKLDYEVDMAGGKLNLFLQDHCPGKAVYWTQAPQAQLPFQLDPAGHINVTMLLDGKPVRVVFEGHGPTVMNMATFRRLFGMKEDAPGMEQVPGQQASIGSNPYEPVYTYPFKSLSAQDVAIANPKIFLAGLRQLPECNGGTDRAHPDACVGGADLYLSLSELRQLHLYFSNKEKLLYLTAADAK